MMKLRSCKDKEINNLPFVVLLHIFSFFKLQDKCRAAMVCRLWREVAKTKCLWKSLCFGDYMSTPCVNCPIAFFKQYVGFSLRDLNLEFVDNHILRHLQRSCPNLQDLMLNYDFEPPDGYKPSNFALLPSSLSSLELNVHYPDDAHYLPNWYESFTVAHFPKLESLTFLQAPNINEAIVQIASLKTLHKLRIYYISEDIEEDAFNALMTLTELTHLGLAGVRDLPVNFARKITQKLPELKVLDLECSSYFVNFTEVRILAQLPNLEWCKLPSTKGVMKALVESVKDMRKLKEVELDDTYENEPHARWDSPPSDLMDLLKTLEQLRPDVSFCL